MAGRLDGWIKEERKKRAAMAKRESGGRKNGNSGTRLSKSPERARKERNGKRGAAIAWHRIIISTPRHLLLDGSVIRHHHLDGHQVNVIKHRVKRINNIGGRSIDFQALRAFYTFLCQSSKRERDEHTNLNRRSVYKATNEGKGKKISRRQSRV